MSASDKFCLRWNDFERSISGSLKDLKNEKEFFDVTLACDDNQLEAHKVILSACSPFFRNILRKNPHQHPLLYLKGVKYADLQSVLNFMYHGEVNVAQEELNSFLAVAEELRVKGLTQGPPLVGRRPSHRPSSEVEEVVSVKSEPVSQFSKRNSEEKQQQLQKRYSQSQVSTELANYGEEDFTEQYEMTDQEVFAEDTMGDTVLDPTIGVGGLSPEDLLQYVAPHKFEDEVGKSSPKATGYICTICGQFKHVWKANVRNHVESKHFKGHFVYRCDTCGAQKSSKQDVYACKSEHNRNSRPLEMNNL